MNEKKRLPVSLTILLPAYNEEQVVGETVKAIKVLHPDFEVLVIDDGSTDNTMKVAMDADAPENAIEWIASLSMQAWFVGLYVAWRRSGFTRTAGVIPPR